MSNSRLYQFMYTKHGKPVIIDCDIPIGATGAVGTVTGTGISSVARNAAGVYQINFVDHYNKFLGLNANLWSPNSGSSILVASAGVTSGTSYIITILGTTTTAGWVTLGLPVGVTPAVGVAFKATATTTASGTGAVQVQSVSGIANVEVLGNPSLTINPSGYGAANGYVIIQTLAATSSSVTTMIATDPANGSNLSLEFYFSDSANNLNAGG